MTTEILDLAKELRVELNIPYSEAIGRAARMIETLLAYAAQWDADAAAERRAVQ
jgi:nucleotide-binding universal stress UspA family protein